MPFLEIAIAPPLKLILHPAFDCPYDGSADVVFLWPGSSEVGDAAWGQAARLARTV